LVPKKIAEMWSIILLLLKLWPKIRLPMIDFYPKRLLWIGMAPRVKNMALTAEE
jgi:hypothetical protein